MANTTICITMAIFLEMKSLFFTEPIYKTVLRFVQHTECHCDRYFCEKENPVALDLSLFFSAWMKGKGAEINNNNNNDFYFYSTFPC